MEYIKKEELIIGEIYKADNGGLTYIMKATKDLKNVKNITEYCDFMKHNYFNGSYLTFTNATPEEKHWLNCCITADKFITFEEAMKTFIPEYVECIEKAPFNCYSEIGTVYKVSVWNFSTTDCVLEGTTSGSTNRKRFKPSTKEDYDAQFVVKEPAENKTELEIWLENTKSLNLSLEDLEKYIGSSQTCNFSNIYMKLEGNRLQESAKILFDKWNEKVIEPLSQFKVIETIETITKVENNEGNQFFIGDVVISSNGIIQTIESFDYNKAKTNIIAFTNKQSVLGIGIDKIEHYIEPNEESLLNKAKRLYPVGTKFINPNGNEECVIKEKGDYFKGNNNNIYHSIAKDVFKYEEGLSGCIYINNTWSKIIE